MQTIHVDGTTYKLNFDKCPIEWAKKARKPYKPAKFKDLRKFPKLTASMSTHDYIREFDKLNSLQSVNYKNSSVCGRAEYDSSIPLVEVLA